MSKDGSLEPERGGGGGSLDILSDILVFVLLSSREIYRPSSH